MTALRTLTLWLLLTAAAFAAQPASPPPIGLCVPAHFAGTRDADTILVQLPGSSFIFALRLRDVWAPELSDKNATRREIAKHGKLWVQELCQDTPDLIVFIDLSGVGRQPLKALTFDRVPAYVWFAGKEGPTLNEQIVSNGFASSTKNGRLGE